MTQRTELDEVIERIVGDYVADPQDRAGLTARIADEVARRGEPAKAAPAKPGVVLLIGLGLFVLSLLAWAWLGEWRVAVTGLAVFFVLALVQAGVTARRNV